MSLFVLIIHNPRLADLCTAQYPLLFFLYQFQELMYMFIRQNYSYITLSYFHVAHRISNIKQSFMLILRLVFKHCRLEKLCPELYIRNIPNFETGSGPNFEIGNVLNFEVWNIPNFEVGNVPNLKFWNCIQSIIMRPGYLT